MENFFCDDRFYDDIGEFIELNDLTKEDVEKLPTDYHFSFFPAKLEPIIQLDANWITERIDNERLPEDHEDTVISKITKILNEVIDFDKLNEYMPKAWYEGRPRRVIHVSRDEMLKHLEE